MPYILTGQRPVELKSITFLTNPSNQDELGSTCIPNLFLSHFLLKIRLLQKTRSFPQIMVIGPSNQSGPISEYSTQTEQKQP